MIAPVYENPAKFYVYHVDHEHDRIYAENVAEYLSNKGASTKVVQLANDSNRPELRECLEDPEAAVLGFNAALDHSWLASERFFEIAERRGLPVMQWILDHPSARWAEFGASTATNSRFLLNSGQQQRYFETYCLPGALTAATGGVGPNWRSRVGELGFGAFMQRPISCLVPLSLRRIRSMEESEAAMAALDRRLAAAARDAVSSARHDLFGSLHGHVAAALAASGQAVSPEMFDTLCQVVEEAVQIFRRLKIFSVVKTFPALIQSDDSAAPFAQGAAASFATNVGMQATLERMPNCRAVLSVTPMNDMIHDRTMNALNAGCLAIAEDNAANRDVFTHSENALLFRYDDNSLEECLDILCSQPERAYKIAAAGMRLRDDPRIRFGQFHSIIDLARQAR
jgi:glycosyl transferase family 1